MKALRAIVLSSMLIGSTGCGTLLTIGQTDAKPYGGVCLDVETITGGPPKPNPEFDFDLRPVAVIDLPFSLIGDTLMLPVTVTYAIQKQMEEGSQKGPATQPPQVPIANAGH